MDQVREIDTTTLKQWMDEGRNIWLTDVYNLKGGVFAWVSSGNTLGTPNYSNAA